MLSIVF